MRFYEYEAKRLLERQGIGVPGHGLARSPAEAIKIASDLGFPVVLKAQVLTGGRMKAGGVRFAHSLEEVGQAASAILDLEIKGHQPRALLIEAKAQVQGEYYLGVTYDTKAKLPLALFSDRGGIEIEEVAQASPEHVAKGHFSALLPFSEYRMKEVVGRLGVSGGELNRTTALLSRLARAFLLYDLTLAEINPLAKLEDGSFVALDARIELEDEALFRQEELLADLEIEKGRSTREATPFERKAAEIDSLDHRGVAGRMVEFQGSLGLLIGGGGASLTAFDAVRRHGGRPANYCEIGGNPSVKKVSELTKLLLSKPGVERIAVIMNVVSNTRVDLVARGVIKGVIEAGYLPQERIAVFRIPGAWEEEGFRLLEKYSVEYLDRNTSIDEAAQHAVRKMG